MADTKDKKKDASDKDNEQVTNPAETKTGIQHFDGTISKVAADGSVVASSYVNYDLGEQLATDAAAEKEAAEAEAAAEDEAKADDSKAEEKKPEPKSAAAGSTTPAAEAK